MTTTEKQLMDAVEYHKRELDEAERVVKQAQEAQESVTITLGNAIAAAAYSNLLSLGSLLSLSRFVPDGSLMFSGQMYDMLVEAAPDFVTGLKVGVTDLSISVSWSDTIDVDALTALIDATREYRMYAMHPIRVTFADTSGEDVLYRWTMDGNQSIFAVDRCAGGRVVEEDIFDGIVESRTLAEHIVTTWTAQHRRSELDEARERVVKSANSMLASLAELPRDQWPDEVIEAARAIDELQRSR